MDFKHVRVGKPIVMTFLVRECYESPEKHENPLKFIKIHVEECFDKVLNEEFKKKLMCKMKNVITRGKPITNNSR
jgi:hypothetical protein